MTTSTKTTMTKTRMTTRIRVYRAAALLLTLAAGHALIAQNAAYAVVAGSVFRESGFSLPGATVTLTPKPDAAAKPSAAATPKDAAKPSAAAKPKTLKSTTDARGEFAFRVPPAAATYRVTASMKGFRPAEGEATIGGEERVDVTLVLSAESK
jgi:carboxypeptidase family protein